MAGPSAKSQRQEDNKQQDKVIASQKHVLRFLAREASSKHTFKQGACFTQSTQSSYLTCNLVGFFFLHRKIKLAALAPSLIKCLSFFLFPNGKFLRIQTSYITWQN